MNLSGTLKPWEKVRLSNLLLPEQRVKSLKWKVLSAPSTPYSIMKLGKKYLQKQPTNIKMKKQLFNLTGMMLLSLLFLTGCNTEPDEVQKGKSQEYSKTSDVTSSFHSSLALRWAPVHYQDTDVTGDYSLNGKSDYITAINFDNDWNATNNWNNIANYAAKAHCYYSVVETATHWFIVYAFFHPRDWTDNPFAYYFDQHENDMEGLLSIIKKDGSQYGNFQGMVTVSHSDFFSFIPNGSPLQSNEESIDGTVTMESFNGELRPATAQEAKGHGLKANPYYTINGDGIKYFPSLNGTAEIPSSANDRDVRYKLVDIFEAGGLWDQRFNTSLFKSAEGSFQSSYGSGGANAPWAWDDGNDTPGWGALGKDPAFLVSKYYKNLGNFSFNYIDNKYIGINNLK